MNIDIYNHIKENNNIVVGGLEGSGKSRDVLNCVLNSDIVDFENEYVIYTTNSYEMLKERQAELIHHQHLTERECPVVAVNEVEAHNKHLIDCKGYYKETKIVLMSIQAVKKCLHFGLDPIGFEKKAKIKKMLIIDEFDFLSTIIPSLDHITNANMLSKSKKSALQFIRENYSMYDVSRYAESMKSSKCDNFMVSYYLKNAELNDCKIVFVTSESIPMILLQELGYSSIINDDKLFKNHKIHIKSDVVNRYTFNRLNDSYKWGIFGFKHIITDKYNPDMQLQNDIVNLHVKSHVSAKGSNSYEGEVKELLTIVSQVPDCVIRSITDAINFYTQNADGSDYYTFESVKALFYRDRLFQAVGRVIGYRGEKSGVKDAWVLISDIVMDGILQGIENNMIEMPYSIIEWDMENEKWNKIVEAVQEDKRITSESKSRKNNSIKEELKELGRNIVNMHIELDEKSYVSASNIKTLMLENGAKGITAKAVSNMLGLKYSMKRIDGKVQRVIVGCKIK